MATTMNERKEKAIELLTKLDIYKPYIKGFKDSNHVCFYENFAGFWAYQEPELQAKIQEIEKEFNCTVYAVTHEYLEFGECYSFLLVSNYKSEWSHLLESEGNKHYAFAYVWNKDVDYFSEFGTVGVQSFGGGIRRFC